MAAFRAVDRGFKSRPEHHSKNHARCFTQVLISRGFQWVSTSPRGVPARLMVPGTQIGTTGCTPPCVPGDWRASVNVGALSAESRRAPGDGEGEAGLVRRAGRAGYLGGPGALALPLGGARGPGRGGQEGAGAAGGGGFLSAVGAADGLEPGLPSATTTTTTFNCVML